MTELQTLLANFARRGTRLTLERTRVLLGTNGLVAFDRFWLSGPVFAGDFERLKRHKNAIVAELECLGRFEMSAGDTLEPNAEPVSLLAPSSVTTVATVQRGRTWTEKKRAESNRKNQNKRKTRQTEVSP